MFKFVPQPLFKPAFVKALQQLVPSITEDDLIPAGAGVRAQACDKDGGLIDDFYIQESTSFIHVLNAPSPAATSSLSIGLEVAERAMKKLNWGESTQQLDKEQLIPVLQKYLPSGSEHYAADLMSHHKIQLRIKNPRLTKLGDYRPPSNESSHRISINRDLNPFSFLITFMQLYRCQFGSHFKKLRRIARTYARGGNPIEWNFRNTGRQTIHETRKNAYPLPLSRIKNW